jgi:hypothetical protein
MQASFVYKHLNILEDNHIYVISKNNFHRNDTYTDNHSPKFEKLYQLNTTR